MSDSLNVRSLLPPNATAFEQTLESSMATALTPEGVKAYPVDESSRSPALFHRHQLGELLPWLPDNQRPSLGEALQCQRWRGTPNALRLALGWLGLTEMVIEDDLKHRHFAEYQCGLQETTVLSDDTLKRVMGLAAWACPVRSRCRRIYNHGYDRRYLVLSESPWGNGLSDDSGVSVATEDEGNPRVRASKNAEAKPSLTVSFGRSFDQTVSVTTKASGFLSRGRFFRAFPDADHTLDVMRLDTRERVFSHQMIFSTQERERVGVVWLTYCVAGSGPPGFSDNETDNPPPLTITRSGHPNGHSH